MAFQLSPGVAITEQDITSVVPVVATSIGAYAGPFVWGPALQVLTVGSEGELVSVFGRPDSATAASFYSAANFLSYAGNLKVVRAIGAGAKNAVSAGTAVTVRNQDHWETVYASGSANVGPFAAKHAGSLGNSLLVSMVDSASWAPAITGTISTSATSRNVAGVGTAFLTEVSAGSVLKTADGIVIGTVQQVDSDTSLFLTARSRVATSGISASALWAYASQFDGAPGTSEYVSSRGSQGDEVHIVVVDAGGLFTGTPGAILERIAFASKSPTARGSQGENNYYVRRLAASKYVWWMDHPASVANWGQDHSESYTALAHPATARLSGGTDAAPTDADVIAAYDLLSDAEAVDMNLLIVGPHGADVASACIEIAESRKDCMVFISPPADAVVANIGNKQAQLDAVLLYRNTTLNANSSYATMDSGWKYQYDRYNDVYRWVPLAGDIAGLCARTDSTNDPWWSPGGLNRGVILNVTKLAYSPDQTHRDELYKVGINPVVSFPGQGTVLWGDKTLLAKPSAFGYINVRRLFIILEKSIASAAKFNIFDFNDAFTRAQFRNMVEPFLRDVRSRRGVTDFLLVCDETNNTGEVIDRAEFVADIFVKPARSINFVRLSFTAVRSSVSFEEVVGA